MCYWGKNRSFRPPFSKGGGVQRRSLWPPSAEGEKLELNLFNSYRQAYFLEFEPLLQEKRGSKTDCE